MSLTAGRMVVLLGCLSLCAGASSQTGSLTVDYTGSLLGYYRIEPDETPRLTPVVDFLANRAQRSDTLLLGMGDNFGPEFGASLQNLNANSHCMLAATAHGNGMKNLSAPESLYKDDDRLTPSRDGERASAACDNVMNFLMRAGYRAVVPGREDFMYTATWLRHAALLLEQEDREKTQTTVSNKDGRLNLLSANLRVSIDTSRKLMPSGHTQGKEYSLKGHCPLLFSAAAFDSASARCSGSNAETDELKWLERLDRLERQSKSTVTLNPQRLTAETPADEAIQAYVAGSPSGQESLLGDQVNILLTAWRHLLGDRVRPWGMRVGSQGPEIDKAIQEKIDELNSLVTQLCHAGLDPHAGSSGGCPDADTADLRGYATELLERLRNVQELRRNPHAQAGTFSLSDAARLSAIHGLLRTIAREQEDVGYTLAGSGSGPKTLLIGVMGTTTFAAVSQVNRNFCIRSGAAGAAPSAWPTDFSSCKASIADAPNSTSIPVGKIVVTDPVSTAAAIIRGVQLLHPEIAAVIVMAQMPHTDAEVLSTKLWARLSSAPSAEGHPLHKVDLVLSEAEASYATGNVSLQYGLKSASGNDSAKGFASPAPVLTPDMSYSAKVQTLPGTVSSATMTHLQEAQYSVTNERADATTFAAPIDTAACLLQLAAQIQTSGGRQDVSPCAPSPRDRAGISAREQANTLELLLMKSLQGTSKSSPDAAILEARDLQFDSAPAEYLTYDVCKSRTGPGSGQDPDPKAYAMCVLHVGLDRIFWKGDYIERVAVKGTDLRSMIQRSDGYLGEESELSDRDITGEWLVSFGITQSALANVTDISRANEPLWIPADPSCHSAAAGTATYCVAGVPLVDDQYYWLLTSDSLAQDPTVYGVLAKSGVRQHEQTSDFLTGEMARRLADSLSGGNGEIDVLQGRNQGAQAAILQNNLAFEQRRLVQVDFSKVVAGFSSRSPVGGNQFVGAYYQGVADSRASAPSSQELDLELASRLTSNIFGQTANNSLAKSSSVGLQSSFAYDRAVLGNLSPATKPINASYALNNLTVGAFLQFRLGAHGGDPVSVRSLPRTLLVLAPRQYQIQLNHQYLFFPFANSSPLPGELTVTLPRTSGWSDRVGIRREFGQEGPKPLFGAGNYIEAGGEFVTQNNVLAAVTLANGATVKTCQVSASITLQTCFSQSPALTITSNTTDPKPPTVNDLNTPGLYWALHLQNHLGTRGIWQQMSLSSDVQGDFYFGRPASAELPTQTEYAIPLSIALTFPTIGNLSFGPTYTAFFYKSQLSSQSLQVNSFSITARWYFARDSSVPIKRQIRLVGPPSADQTKTAKIH